MQLKSSLKQLFAESRVNPGFTALYIGGVAFAVAFTMVAAIIYYVHLADIYPEYNRKATYYLNNITIRNEEKGITQQSSIGLPFFKQFYEDSPNIECYSVYSTARETSFIQPADQSGDIKVVSKQIDPNFFRIYDYEFIAGHPFNEAEHNAGIKNAIIDRTLATRLYSSPENAIGKEISINFTTFRVSGVVKDGTPVAYTSFANVFIPYTVYMEDYSLDSKDRSHLLGNYISILMFKDQDQAQRFKDEMTDKVNRYNTVDSTDYKVTYNLVSHPIKVLSKNSGSDLPIMEYIKPLLYTLLILLIIPAINISGIISGQMDRRIAEIGVRRSFGATRAELTRAVMTENLILTIIGGFIGLIIAWIVIIVCRKWILTLIVSSWENIETSAETLSTEMLVSPIIFLATLVFCVILNTLSASIPVMMSLRRPIVSSLNSKR